MKVKKVKVDNGVSQENFRIYSWLYYILPPAILGLLTALIYYPTLHYEFQFDDVANISKYFTIRSNSFSSLFFTGSRWISYWLNSIHYQIGKFDPFSYRIGNVIIHSTNGILLFFVLFLGLSRLRKQSFFSNNALVLAVLTSLLFLLHPVQTQTVSYVIQGQLEGLAVMGTLSMVLCFLLLTRAASAFARVAFTALLFVLAAFICGTKEIAIISPAMLLLVDWFFVAQGNWKSLKSRFLLHSMIFAFVGVVYIYLLKPSFFINILGFKLVAKNNIGNVITHEPNATITPFHFFFSQFKVILHYLWIFIWPLGISVEYDWMLCKSFFSFDCLVPLLVLSALVFGVARLLKRDSTHLLAFGALWFCFSMAPRSSIIPSPELLVDYKTYMGSIGILFILAAALVWLAEFIVVRINNPILVNNHGRAQLALGLLLLVPISIATVQRNKVWSSGLNFWGNVIANAPGKARAYNNYGVELSQTYKKFEEAIPYFNKAIAMDDRYPDPCNNLAVAYTHLGDHEKAAAALRQGLRINPYYPEGYNNIASYFLQKKDYAQAEQALRTALKLRPHYGKAYFNLGRMYLDQGETEKAWECFKSACTKADLDTDVGFNIYAKVSMSLGKYDDAIFGYKKTLELNPNQPEPAFNLGNAYFLTKQYQEAARAFEYTNKIAPQELRAYNNLGETYISLEQYDKALKTFEALGDNKSKFPNVFLRMAICHEKLGNKNQAKNVLMGFLADQTLVAQAPDALKQAARSLLAQLNGGVVTA